MKMPAVSTEIGVAIPEGRPPVREIELADDDERYQWRKFTSTSEIEEEEEEEEDLRPRELMKPLPLATIQEEVESGVFPFGSRDGGGGGDDVVYVAVGKSESSMEALVWTLNHLATPSTLVYLLHIFPETHLIPSPLGNLPISRVNPEQKENYMVQERSKRGELLQKYMRKCHAYQVRADTILIESDMEAKAILDLIIILNIRKLVMGISKSNLRKMRGRRGSGIADQILQSAEESCEVKIICEGKEIDYQILNESPSQSSRSDSQRSTPKSMHVSSPKASPEANQNNGSLISACFKAKVTI